MDKTPTSPNRVRGLDSIRFVCALWVFFGHFAAPPLTQGIDLTSFWGRVVGAVGERTFTGTPAVIIFFIISGFCIHFPYSREPGRINLPEFYSRRFLRILIPVAVAVPLSKLVDVRLSLFEESVLWSLVAELIYYCLYPALRAAAEVSSWRVLIVSSFVGALLVAASNPGAVRYPSFGSTFNWALGLPCWLLGCALAESIRHGKQLPVSRIRIWCWRCILYVSGMLCIFLRFRDVNPIGFPWTLNLFAIVATFWLSREIAYFRRHTPNEFLERAGIWSYSLYLMHMPAKPFFEALQLPNLGYLLNWAVLCLFVLAFCFVFYLLVEQPGHEIARRVSKFFGKLKHSTKEFSTSAGQNSNAVPDHANVDKAAIQ